MARPAVSATTGRAFLPILRPLRTAMCLFVVVTVASLAVLWHFSGVHGKAAQIDNRFEALHELSLWQFRSSNPYVGYGSQAEITCRTALPPLHDAVWTPVSRNVFT